jgi:hypothetical protein
MTTTDILTDMVLVESEKTATTHAPVERVDIADWLLHLPDAEYQRCAPPDHIAARTTTTDDGPADVDQRGGDRRQPHGAALRGRGTGTPLLPECGSATCRHRPAGRRSR